MIWGGGLGQRSRDEYFFPGQPADEFSISRPNCWSIFFLGNLLDWKARIFSLSILYVASLKLLMVYT